MRQHEARCVVRRQARATVEAERERRRRRRPEGERDAFSGPACRPTLPCSRSCVRAQDRMMEAVRKKYDSAKEEL